MGADVFLDLVAPVTVRDHEGLPAVRVVDEIGTARQRGVSQVDRTIPRPDRVGDTACGELSELVRPSSCRNEMTAAAAVLPTPAGVDGSRLTLAGS
jgi:hypothetical protein